MSGRPTIRVDPAGPPEAPRIQRPRGTRPGQGTERLARGLDRLLREPAGLGELRLARLVRRLQLSHAGLDLLPLALTRLGLLLAQRGEARLELGVLLSDRLVDAIHQGIELASLPIDRLLHVRLRLARGLAKLGAKLIELRPRGLGLADQLVIDDIAREATEGRPSQRPEAGVDRRHPRLIDVRDDSDLARRQ